MKEFQKGILDNDKVITAENVQCMGEVIALCVVKTVMVRGGKDLHNLYKGLLRDINRSNDATICYSDGYDTARSQLYYTRTEFFFQHHIGISLFLNHRTIRWFSLYKKNAVLRRAFL